MSDDESTQAASDFLTKLEKVAAVAGVIVDRVPGDMLAASFDLGNGRNQVVYINSAGVTLDGRETVAFMSPCLELGFRGLSRKRAIALLQRNSDLVYGAFSLLCIPGEPDHVVVRSTQILDTMQIDEFTSHLHHTAHSADTFELELGRDDF
jgi:hypothetical protein